MMRLWPHLVLAGLAAAAAAPASATSTCLERCQKERGLRRRALDTCLAEAAKEAAEARAKGRLECRRRSIIPTCDGLPPCTDSPAPTVGIDVLAHYFSREENGEPLTKGVFSPGDTLYFRYQGVLMPDQAGEEVVLEADVALKQGARAIETRARNLQLNKRLSGAQAEDPIKFGSRASFILPSKILPGEYVIEVILREAKSGISATRGYLFTVAADSARPAGKSPRPAAGSSK